MNARERWNAIRSKSEPPAVAPEPPAGPSSVVAGTPGAERVLEGWGMIEAYPEPDWYERMVWERNRR
jgi:hypothetical protein